LPEVPIIEPVWLDLPEARLYGEWRRPPVAGRPTVVVLHDGLGCTKTVRDFPDRLGDALGVGAFVYDRWGYGRSDRREAFPFQFMEEEAERLPRVLDAAGIADCVLVGHSDGGTITLLHAAANPGRVRAAATIAAHVFIDRLTNDQLERHQKMVETGSIPDFMFRFHGERGPHVLWCWTSMWRDERYRVWHIGERIRTIRGPLLSIQGETDAYGLPEQIATIQSSVPHARTLLMPGLGHFPHIENPEIATRTVADFLAPYCG
jgi:pimeloyl-ACP methyl ester carboxylesterase